MAREEAYWEILQETLVRAASAAASQSGLASQSAQGFLRNSLGAAPGAPGSLLSEPVFEPAPLWRSSGETTGSLEGQLLSRELVEALATAGDDVEVPRERPVFTHQLEAWQAALAEPRRHFVVTSGTGSGKTESFMIPILEDLVRRPPVPGGAVRAIMLYPLNALIESQRRRLGAWLGGFGGSLRYALYKGDMPEQLAADARRRTTPWEVPDRKRLRERPPEILVTNITMLEFMTVRPQDRTVLERSRGQLRWIVLDEAHSYSGAQAAELAMLLRRVRDAFGVRPEDVRLLATSATIGTRSEDSDAALRAFIAGLGDTTEDRVEVIHGQPLYAPLPKLDDSVELPGPEVLGGFDDRELFERLAPNRAIQRVIGELRSEGRATLRRTAALLGISETALPAEETMALMEAAGRAVGPDGGGLVPWRLHAFMRAQAGLWSCCDPTCPNAGRQLGAEHDWPFGALYLVQRERCDCGAPVFEVETCRSCATPALRVKITGDEPPRLEQPGDSPDEDEFALDIDDPDEGEEAVLGLLGSTDARLLPPNAGRLLPLAAESAILLDAEPTAGERTIRVRLAEDGGEGCCSDRTPVRRRLRYGAPFLLGTVLPTLLRAAPPHEKARHPGDKPSWGRRLLTFTDSRQGTARFAAKLQQESERALVRAVIWHAVEERPPEPENADRIRQEIKSLQSLDTDDPVIQDIISGKEAQLSSEPRPVPWQEMVERLSKNHEFLRWAALPWQSQKRSDGYFRENKHRLAEMLLYREVLRRPKFLNNVETLGMAALRCVELEAAELPQCLLDGGRGPDEWVDFLRLCIDFAFRQNLAADVSEPVLHWASPQRLGAAPFFVGPGAERPTSRAAKPWPSSTSGPRSRLLRFARLMLNVSGDDPAERDAVDMLLRAAWTALAKYRVIHERGPEAWVLDYTRLAFVPCHTAWICPLTLRMLSYAPLGVSPYTETTPATQVQLPPLPIARSGGLSDADRAKVREWLQRDPSVAKVREETVWRDLHDRAAAFESFCSSAEHSAQIPRGDLERYEKRFEEGELNILSCSTTMEMGVDIAGVGVVANANVPPSPANYRQRVGRAGRRGEARALAFTFCQDKLRDRAAFDDPGALLAAAVSPPSIRLDSPVIAARHVHAFYLGAILKDRTLPTSVFNLRAGEFFGGPEALDDPFHENAPAATFLEMLRSRDGFAAEVHDAARALVHGTPLAGHPNLASATADTFELVREAWRREWEGIVGAANLAGANPAARKGLELRLRRFCREFLLRELSARGFTPAYGFPTNVLSFSSPLFNLRDADAASERFGGQALPSRSLDIAIREYAPGADVVVDGLVYRSSGVTPAWQRPQEPTDVEDLRQAWRCRACLAFGVDVVFPAECPDCGAVVSHDFELLRPAGFASNEEPHARYEQSVFVRPAEPWISARGGQVIALPDPGLGVMRVASGGTILFHTGGPGGNGYALCLECGRAEPETGRPESAPALPRGFDSHPLPWGRTKTRSSGRRTEAIMCPGTSNSQSFKVRRHVHLGGTTTTDVFELRLDTLPNTRENRKAGLAIAAALREALARRTGIDAQDMGVVVRGQSDDAGEAKVTAVLYDRPAGGAGFAPLAADGTPGLLHQAREILACPAGDACLHACPRCVLARDLEFDPNALDRVEALRFLDDQVLPRMVTPANLHFFGKGTHVSLDPMTALIDRVLSRQSATEIDLVLAGDPMGWEFPAWPVRELRPLWPRARRIRLLARPESLTRMSTGQKLALERVLSETGAELCALGPEMKLDHGGTLIAALGAPDGGWRRYGARGDAAEIGPRWGSVEAAPLGWLGGFEPIEAQPLDRERFLAIGLENARLIHVSDQLDGPVADFGRGFWQFLYKEKPQIGSAAGAQILQIRYSDRYIHAPLPALLLAKVLAAAPRSGPVAEIGIRTTRPWQRSVAESTVWSDWPRAETRDEVLRRLLAGAAEKVVVETLPKQQTRHDRTLEITWSSGLTLALILDQGFGAWRVEGRARHDFHADSGAQAAALRRATFSVARQGEPTLLVLRLEETTS